MLELKEWLRHPASEKFRHLWAGPTNFGFAGIVFLSKVDNEHFMERMGKALPGTEYVNKISSTNALLSFYRQWAMRMVLASYAVILLLLLLRYRGIYALRVLMPPVIAAVVTLGVLGFLEVPVCLFHIIALLLVLGVGIDYAIFFAEGRSKPEHTMLAVMLSCCTTLLSFGLLALSETGVLNAIGLTVLIGISVAMVFAPLSLQGAQPERSA